jgi:aspartate racemase
MKTLGLIGGMSWESTTLYYQILNRTVRQTLGGTHSCKMLLYSVDFQEIATLQFAGDWATLTDTMTQAAQRLEAAGADAIMICTNTMHKMADAVAAKIQIPLLHIADAAGAAITAQGLKKLALLGTKFTMEQDFMRQYYQKNFGIEVVIPNAKERDEIHHIIYNELTKGVFTPQAKARFVQIIERMTADEGIEGMISGCTEIEMLLQANDLHIPFFETTRLHAQSAVQWALKK